MITQYDDTKEVVHDHLWTLSSIRSYKSIPQNENPSGAEHVCLKHVFCH